MRNLKKVSILASALIIIGAIGIIFTFNSMSEFEKITEEQTIQEQFTDIHISANNAKIAVLPINEPEAILEITGRINNNRTYKVSTDVENSVLSIDVDHKLQKLINFFPSSLAVTLFVPDNLYDSLQIEGGNGHIQIDDFEANDINIKTDNGKIVLNHITTETITALTSNGKLELQNVVAQEIDVQSSNGKINLIQVEGNILGKTDNGSIFLETNDLDRAIELETDNGKIDIQTANKPTNATINVFVDNGKIDVFGSRSPNTVIGNGVNAIQLTTNNGKISIEHIK